MAFSLGDRAVTVLKTDGSPPSFIYCEITQENPAENQYIMDCSAASAWLPAPCTLAQWTPIASGLQIGRSFLLPDETRSTLSGTVQPIFRQSSATTAACRVTGGAAPVNLTAGASYEGILEIQFTVDETRSYTNRVGPATSSLLNTVTGAGGLSQTRSLAPPLPADGTEAIRTWVIQGATNN